MFKLKFLNCSIVVLVMMHIFVGSFLSTALAQTPQNQQTIEVLDRLLANAQSNEDVRVDDMIFAAEDLRAYRAYLSDTGSTGGSSSVFQLTRKWPNGKVFYTFNNNVDATNRQRFEAACREWERHANLEFILRTNQPNYIVVNSSSENSSRVGMSGGSQGLQLVSWNYPNTIAHEIAHALGVLHEHQRTDRNDYVSILKQNIIQEEVDNFDLITNSLNYGSSDFDSLMHYPYDAFSKYGYGTTTIEPKPAYANKKFTMGQFSGLEFKLSASDKAGMAQAYGPNIDNVNPTVRFTSPVPNATVSAMQPISGYAQDNIGVAQVRLSIGRVSDGLYWTGSYWGPRTELPTSLDNPNATAANFYYNGLSSVNLTSGGYVLTARVFDIAGNSVDVPISVNVSIASASWVAIDAATGSDNRTRQVWQRNDGSIELWTVSNTGVKQSTGPVYPLPSGLRAVAIAVGIDSYTRLLCTNSNGQVGLYTFNSNGILLSGQVLQAHPQWSLYGYVPVDLGVDSQGKIYVLYRANSNWMQLQRLNSAYAVEGYGPQYGYSEWTPNALSIGGDDFPRILWNHVSGIWNQWITDPNGAVIREQSFPALSGWTVKDIAVDMFNTTHIMWVSSNGSLRLQLLDANYQPGGLGPVYGYAGWTPTAIGVSAGNGSDNLSRVLWTQTGGQAGLLSYSAAGVLGGYTTYPVHP